MGTTANFLKLRASSNPKVGQWNKDYKKALALAKKEGKFIVTAWSNGDKCGYCVTAESCMMEKTFKDWMVKANAYFVFQYSGDSDAGKTVKDWIYSGTGLRYYPGFRITLYSADGKKVVDVPVEGNTLRSSKTGATGAKAMIQYLEKVFAKAPIQQVSQPAQDSNPSYKVRFNEKLTVKKINAILDAIDKNDGYCPCQLKSEDSKCHCKDFKENKKIGEPCICNIYVKK